MKGISIGMKYGLVCHTPKTRYTHLEKFCNFHDKWNIVTGAVVTSFKKLLPWEYTAFSVSKKCWMLIQPLPVKKVISLLSVARSVHVLKTSIVCQFRNSKITPAGRSSDLPAVRSGTNINTTSPLSKEPAVGRAS